MKITGKKALITGAASGIGQATAFALASLGARVFITDINKDGLEQTARTITQKGGAVELAQALDISDYNAVKAFADGIHQKHGALDILINNAGVAIFAQLEDMSHEDWRKVIDVNLWGVIHGIECFVPEMIRQGQGGHVVSVASTAGLLGIPWHIAYCASKHAVVGMSEVMRYDLKKHGINVTVICPGAVNTGLVETVDIRADPEKVKSGRKFFKKVALSPEKVASQIVRAIKKNRFMVITSTDIKIVYFLKQKMFPVFHGLMRFVSSQMDRRLGR